MPHEGVLLVLEESEDTEGISRDRSDVQVGFGFCLVKECLEGVACRGLLKQTFAIG